MINGVVKCNNCLAVFPRHWIAHGTYSACQMGVFHFCSQKCKQVFIAQNALPIEQGRDVQFKLELHKLQSQDPPSYSHPGIH